MNHDDVVQYTLEDIRREFGPCEVGPCVTCGASALAG
ncbi:hypothetical protein FHX47_000214 [Garicola koreensis]|uniref:Uncharacterized protein n=1 Tax=Garicola koreensis TaxID=1262554 RepID=A0A7W5XYL4_9MICC|nr:hypothetical protein [Garicola koreensis]